MCNNYNISWPNGDILCLADFDELKENELTAHIIFHESSENNYEVINECNYHGCIYGSVC